MKKTFKLFVAALMLLGATSANAQFSQKENNRVPDRFHMGLRFAYTANTSTWENVYSKKGNTLDTKTLSFGSFGIGMDFQVAPVPVFLETGFYYVNKGFMLDTDKWKYDEMQHLHMLEIPFVISYHINVAPNLFINPFLGAYYAAGGPDGDLWKDIDADDALSDYGLRFGCGLNFGRLVVNMGYDYGLADIEPNKKFISTYSSKTPTFKTGMFFMTLGFNWAGSR